jgi:hypothetical protein
MLSEVDVGEAAMPNWTNYAIVAKLLPHAIDQIPASSMCKRISCTTVITE